MKASDQHQIADEQLASANVLERLVRQRQLCRLGYLLQFLNGLRIPGGCDLRGNFVPDLREHIKLGFLVGFKVQLVPIWLPYIATRLLGGAAFHDEEVESSTHIS